jgi:hypothetical protein
MHLCTENIRSRIRSPRSLPSKIHAATPPQNLAAVESLLRAKRAARSSFSWPHGLLSERNREDQHAFYLAAAFPIGTKWLGALFTYVRHSVLPRHSYDLASYHRGAKSSVCVCVCGLQGPTRSPRRFNGGAPSRPFVFLHSSCHLYMDFVTAARPLRATWYPRISTLCYPRISTSLDALWSCCAA